MENNELEKEKKEENSLENSNDKHSNLLDDLKPNHLDDKQKKTFKNRALYALILFGSAVPAYILGGWFFFVYTILFIIAAVYEFSKVPFQKTNISLLIASLIIVFSLIFWPTLKFLVLPTNEAIEFPRYSYFVNEGFYSQVWLSPIAIAVALGTYFTISVFKENFTVSHVFYFFGMSLLFGIGFQSILAIRYLPFRAFELLNGVEYINTPFFKYVGSMLFVVFSVGGITLTDVFAYIFGIFFGKHKLNSRISPNKTVEGFIGGIVSSIVITLIFGLVAAYCGHPILPIYDLDHWYLLVILCLGIPFASTLGDFAFSAIKRQFGIKDFSNILGSMGGVIDRIDSIMFGMMFVIIYTTFVSNVCGGIYYY